MASMATTECDAVRAQNDRLRRDRLGGAVVVTSGLRALGVDRLASVMAAVASFDAFTPDNDPYGEHDFGQVTVGEASVFFKIDAYDLDLRFGSPDPTDAVVTRRVMTVMLAEEY